MSADWEILGVQKVLNKYLLELLPDDSHERCRGKAFVSPYSATCWYISVMMLAGVQTVCRQAAL